MESRNKSKSKSPPSQQGNEDEEEDDMANVMVQFRPSQDDDDDEDKKKKRKAKAKSKTSDKRKTRTRTGSHDPDPPPTANGGSSSSSKYSSALQTLLPYRSEPTGKGGRTLLPSSHSGLLSFGTFSWLSPLLFKAFKGGLEVSDLWDLDPADKAERNAKRLSRLWEEEQEDKEEDPSFFRAVWAFGRTRFLLVGVLMVVSVILQFLGPSLLLKEILAFQEDLSSPLWMGVALAVTALGIQAVRNFIFSIIWAVGIHTGMRVQGAMQLLTYEKILRLRASSSDSQLLSQAISFVTVDQERVYEAVSGGVLAVAAPVMFLLCVVYTTVLLGPWALLGNGVIFLFYPIMGAVARRTAECRRKAVQFTNQRVALMTEILNGIKFIKAAGLEGALLGRIKDIRDSEEALLRTAAFLQSLSCTIIPMINITAAVVVFIGYTISGNDLTPHEAFTIFSVFSAMSFTFGSLPYAIRSLAEAGVCFRNFGAFLRLPDRETLRSQGQEEEEVDDREEDHESVISMRDASFSWNEEEEEEEKKKVPSCLSNINLRVKRGSLLGVSGAVGSGKSALLSALLGDLVKISGRVLVRGSLAVVPQRPWIFADSLRENILLGLGFNKERYESVLDLTCLRQDIESMPEKDLTLLGERGVNLSGGQKSRVNLARALYADKSILLLDDPFSSLDNVVAMEVFKEAVLGALKDKTVILVSNNPTFLGLCDQVVLMEEGGHLTPVAKEEAATKVPQVTLKAPLKKKSTTTKEDHHDVLLKLLDECKSPKTSSYLFYIRAGGGLCLFSLLLSLFLLFVAMQHSTQVWLSLWLKGPSSSSNFNATEEEEAKDPYYVTDSPDLHFYLGIMSSIVVCTFLVGLFKGLASSRFVLKAASSFHSNMLTSVLGAKMTFFDSTASGKILSRFSKDVDEGDSRLPFFFEFVTQSVLFVLLALLITTAIYPLFALGLIAILGTLVFLDIALNRAMRETRRLETILKAPVVHALTSTFEGLPVIRTFRKEASFKASFSSSVNAHLGAEAVYRASVRWFSFRMDGLGMVTIFLVFLISVLSRGTYPPSVVGLAVGGIYSLCIFVPFVMRMKSELQARFLSVERMVEYSNQEPEEEKEEKGTLEGTAITFEGVSLHHEDTSVLKEISFEIKSGEKVGIVGRTGAGKSSLFSALLRLYPLSSGRILVGPQDIQNTSLRTLRSSISLLPQDPVVFGATIRYNLDPFGQASDPQLIQVLERVHLRTVGLERVVLADWSNLSVGERQLLCLGRALLRGSKILLLDEATASLDGETEALVQRLIQDAFKDCTVLTIAHRTESLLTSCDRVLVLDDGKVLEFDTPQALLEKEGSHFAAMMTAGGGGKTT